MKTIPRRHLQIFQPRDGVDLIELPPNHLPDTARNAAGRLAVDAVQISLVASAAIVRDLSIP
jgi:hypothetical protein